MVLSGFTYSKRWMGLLCYILCVLLVLLSLVLMGYCVASQRMPAAPVPLNKLPAHVSPVSYGSQVPASAKSLPVNGTPTPNRSPLKGYSQYYDNGEPARPLPYRRLYPTYEKLSRPVIQKMLETLPRLQALRDRLAAQNRLEPADLHRPEDLQLLGAISSELSLQANALNDHLKQIADPMGPAAMGLIQQLKSWQEMSETVAQLQDAVGYWHQHDQTFRRYGLSDWQLDAGHADVIKRLDAALLQLGQLAQIERARRELNVISPP